MTFQELIIALEDYHPVAYMETDTRVPIYTVMVVDCPVKAQGNILYIAKTVDCLRELAASEEEDICNILALQRIQELPENLAIGRLNLYCVSGANLYPVIMEKIARLNSLEMKYKESAEVLTAALLSNRGNQNLLDRANELLGNPILQIGLASENILYSCSPEELKSCPELERIVTQIRCEKLTASSAAAMSRLMDGDAAAMLAGDNCPEILHRFNTALQTDQISVLLRVKHLEVGIITVYASGRPFQEPDERIIQCLSVLVGQELQKKSLYTRNPNEIKAQFLNHLISSRTVSEDYIYQMTQLRYVTEIKDKFYLMVVESIDDAAQLDANLFSGLVAQIQSILMHGLYLVRDTELVVLFNLPERADIHELIDHVLTPKCEKYHLIAGISNMYRDLRETSKYYHQAQKAASLGAFYQDSALNYFSDIAPKEILHYMASQEDLLSFCVPEMLDLMNYDKENGTELIDTLYIYLEHVGRTVPAAQALYIHKNTLLYRIAKIKEILHCNMEKGEDVYKLMLSIRILRTLMLYTPPELRKNKMFFPLDCGKNEVEKGI